MCSAPQQLINKLDLQCSDGWIVCGVILLFTVKRDVELVFMGLNRYGTVDINILKGMSSITSIVVLFPQQLKTLCSFSNGICFACVPSRVQQCYSALLLLHSTTFRLIRTSF